MNENGNYSTIGYILKKFPVLSETFILNEILALEEQGMQVQIFSLERPNDPRFHEDLPRLKAQVSYIPDALDFKQLWQYRKRAAHSFRKNYNRTVREVYRHLNPELYWRFLQSCYVANQVKRHRIGHLHAHFANRPATVAHLVSCITGVSYSFTAHAMDIFKSTINPRVLSKKIRQSAFVVTVSDFNLRHLRTLADTDTTKIVKVLNGINLERFQENGRPQNIAPFTFLCVARFVEKKGHAILLDACKLLQLRNSAFQVLLVGKGNLRTMIAARIKELGLEQHVKLMGAHTQEEVVKRYHDSHAFVLPCVVGTDGNRDGLPVSIVEALACGLPVIATPMTGIPEVVRDNYNGFLVPFRDPQLLADAMQRIMTEPLIYEGLKANARASVHDDFDLKRTTAELRRLFRECLP